MKCTLSRSCISPILISLFILFYSEAYSQSDSVQNDPVIAPNTIIPPVLNGAGDDSCWQNAAWQPIKKVWIPYAAAVDSSDCYGRYKVIWSSTTNLLYFLIEVTDDVFVDGFNPAGGTADIYNYDIAEVFIDENKSGGLHIFDATGTDTVQFGNNAENAFAYHIYSAFPADGNVTTDHYVYDMDGRNWSVNLKMNYTSHLPGFSMRKNGNKATWEFSLIVYKDNYEDTMANKEAARSLLTEGKEMGLSVAYCDNDNPSENPKVRDNMLGSVAEPSPGNLHWQNASYFGHVMLTTGLSSGVQNKQPVSAGALRLFPNPASNSSQFEVSNPYRGEVLVQMFNILGQEISRINAFKSEAMFRQIMPLKELSAGTYFIRVRMGKIVYGEKLLVFPHP